jgi:hypothetical protein
MELNMTSTIKVKHAVAFIFTAMLHGCSLNTAGLHHAQSENKDIEIVGTTAGVRGILLRKQSSESVYCAEPQPDATVSESMSENIAASQSAAGTESEGASESAGESSLGGRSVNVLITREIFYRTCEFLANANLTGDTKLAVFKASLQSIIALNSKNLGNGTRSQSNRSATNLGIETDTTILPDSDAQQATDNEQDEDEDESLNGN